MTQDKNTVNDKLKPYLWVIPLGLLMPLAQALVFFARFGQMDNSDPLGLVFLPVGLISGIVLIYLLERTQSRNRKISTIAGYVIALPVAFIGALGSGLLLPALIGVSICGPLPLIAGAATGYAIGARWETSAAS